MRLLTAAVAVAAVACAGSIPAAVRARVCDLQEIQVQQHGKATSVVGGGLVCAGRTATGGTVSIAIPLALPAGHWTVYFIRLYSRRGQNFLTATSIRTTRVDGGRTVVLTDSAVVPTGRRTAAGFGDDLSIVRGAVGCRILRHGTYGPALLQPCPVWASTTLGPTVSP